MKTAANSVVILLVSLFVTTFARGASQARELLAEGSSDRLWVADVVRADDLTQPAAERTRVYSVAVPQDGWQRPMLIGAGVRDVTHRGTQLVALLKTGEWMFVWQDGRSTGPALPANGEMICIGGDGSTVWAVGRVAGGMKSLATPPTTTTAPATTTEPAEGTEAPATAATTQESSPATTQPDVVATTAPATGPVKLVLFRLDRSTWVPEGELPEAIPASIDPDLASLTVVHGRICLSVALAGDAVIYERDGEQGWSETGRLRPDGTHVVRAKVLDGGDRPIVWTAGLTGAGALYFGNGLQQDRQWGKPVELRVQSDFSQPLPRDVTVVAQRIRLVFARNDKLFLQSFDWRDGKPAGQLTTVLLSTANGVDSKVGFWLNAAVMVVLLMVMVGAMRRRGEIEETVRHLDEIPLAPLPTRLAAAVVDLWPQWAVFAIYLVMRPEAMDNPEATVGDPLLPRLAAIAMGVYILHTMVLEMLLGASVGKLIFGLRVVQLNGERPSMGSIFVRNLMRAIDVGLILVGLAMIVMSPLRQRVGDLAAGTIVVRNTARNQNAPNGDAAGTDET